MLLRAASRNGSAARGKSFDTRRVAGRKLTPLMLNVREEAGCQDSSARQCLPCYGPRKLL